MYFFTTCNLTEYEQRITLKLSSIPIMPEERENKITVEYCVKCKFMMRSAWIAQELLQTFEGDLDEAALRPSEVPGIWRIYANGQQVWDRKTERGLPELKDLKRRVRDVIAPGKDLGHAETIEPKPE